MGHYVPTPTPQGKGMWGDTHVLGARRGAAVIGRQRRAGIARAVAGLAGACALGQRPIEALRAGDAV